MPIEQSGHPLNSLIDRTTPIGRSPRGRPLMSGGFVSLSHTNQRTAAAYCASAKVGVDLSGPEDAPHLEAAAPVFLSEQEAKSVSALPYVQRQLYLQQLWTLKEALLKGIGIGLGLDPRKLDFRGSPTGWECACAPRWRFQVRQFAGGYLCAVALKCHRTSIQWHAAPLEHISDA